MLDTGKPYGHYNVWNPKGIDISGQMMGLISLLL